MHNHKAITQLFVQQSRVSKAVAPYYSNATLLKSMAEQQCCLDPIMYSCHVVLLAYSILLCLVGKQQIPERDTSGIKLLQDPDDFCYESSKEQDQLRQRLVEATKKLKGVHMPPDVQLKISEVCSLLDVDGIRGDIVTNRAAKALVAFEGREEVAMTDVEKVIGLCLNHRFALPQACPVLVLSQSGASGCCKGAVRETGSLSQPMWMLMERTCGADMCHNFALHPWLFKETS